MRSKFLSELESRSAQRHLCHLSTMLVRYSLLKALLLGGSVY